MYFTVNYQYDFKIFEIEFTTFSPGFSLLPFMNAELKDLSILYDEWLNKEVRKFLKEEDIPNLWDKLGDFSNIDMSRSFSERDLGFFTAPEKDQVRKSLREFRRLLLEEYNPVNDQLELIDEKLEYLSEAVDRLNRFDWKGVALATTIGIATTMTIDTNTLPKIIQLFQQAFETVIKLLN